MIIRLYALSADRSLQVLPVECNWDYLRGGLAIGVEFSLPTAHVIRILNQLLECREKPSIIRCLLYEAMLLRTTVSHEFVCWVIEHSIRVECIQPDKSQDNAYIERYNETVSYNWMSKHLFDRLEQVQNYATRSLLRCNYKGPDQTNRGKPPLRTT